MKQANPGMKYKEIAQAIVEMHKKMDAGQRQMLVQLREAQEKILEQRQKEIQDEEMEDEIDEEDCGHSKIEDQEKEFEKWAKRKKEMFGREFRLNDAEMDMLI